MRDAQGEEFKHFCMDLELLLGAPPPGARSREGILFQPGDVVENGEEAEAGAFEGDGAGAAGSYADSSLGIGSLRGAA